MDKKTKREYKCLKCGHVFTENSRIHMYDEHVKCPKCKVIGHIEEIK